VNERLGSVGVVMAIAGQLCQHVGRQLTQSAQCKRKDKMQIQPVASHFINGEYLEDTSGEPIDIVYPATGEIIGRVYAATEAVIEQAIISAKRAQKEWAKTSGTERGRILRRAADIIRERNHDLSVLETYDTGKPLSETLYVDATSAADALEYFGGLAGSLTGEHIPMGENWAYTIREPLGLCVGIGAWNYPTQISCWKGAPALACGNAMIFKPSETTPLCALKVAEILIEAGLPRGLYNVIQGMGDVGAKLVSDTRVDKVSLTGSVPTGRKVYAAAAEGIKHVTMELGGKSPLIIFDDADIENAVGGAILGNFYSSGQVCSNGTRVFVHEAIKEKFLERLSARLREAIIGDPLDEATNFGPMVSERQMKIVQDYIEIGKSEGARLISGGGRLDHDGFYLEPTVFADVRDDMSIAREEIFGPVMAVLDFTDETDVIARANDTEFGLASYFYTKDINRIWRVSEALEYGMVGINEGVISNEVAPFGGVKESGLGREGSHYGIDDFMELKYICMGGLK